VALFDELVKIAEEKKPSHALRTMAVGAAGGAVGYGAAELLARNLKFFKEPTPRKATAAKVILPILSGVSVMLADRYRQKMNEEYKKIRGYDAK
jgi:hypothetical protein